MNCPECGSELVLRNGRNGKFYGCGNFPQCRHTESANTTVSTSKPARDSALRAFNQFVASKGWTQSQGSKWIQQTLGLNWDEAKIETFDEKRCETLVAYIKLEGVSGGQSDIALAFERAKQRRKK